jgi:hypothetical protein
LRPSGLLLLLSSFLFILPLDYYTADYHLEQMVRRRQRQRNKHKSVNYLSKVVRTELTVAAEMELGVWVTIFDPSLVP